MRCSFRLQLPIAIPLCLCAQLVVAQSAPRTKPIVDGENAAVKYLRADASLRQSYPLPPDAWVTLEKALQAPIDNNGEKLVTAADEALREFERGAHLAFCDWQISTEDGPVANTSHRGAVRELAAVAGLRARLRFRDGNSQGAMQDVLAALTAARHLSLDGSIASALFGYRIERELSGVLEQNLTLLSPPQLSQLEIGINHIPNGSTLANALQSEKVDRNDFLNIVSRAHDRDDLIQRITSGVRLLQGNKQTAAEIVDGCGGSVAGVSACIDQQSAFYRKWASHFNLAPEEFEKRYKAELEHESQGNPVIALLTPSISGLRWAQAYSQTRFALLKAAVSVARDGPGARARYPDPYDGALFSYTRFDGGFTLTSELRENGVPLSVMVRPPEAHTGNTP